MLYQDGSTILFKECNMNHVPVQCPTCNLVNHSMLVQHSEVSIWRSSAQACLLVQTYISN